MALTKSPVFGDFFLLCVCVCGGVVCFGFFLVVVVLFQAVIPFFLLESNQSMFVLRSNTDFLSNTEAIFRGS